MKVYFDGGSWTRGLQRGEPIKEESFPHQFCKTLNCDYDNVSTKGSSNMRVVRQLLTEYDISGYDLAIFQFTQPTRLEYVKDGEWTSQRTTHKNVFWNAYYKDIYEDLYGQTLEKIHMETVRNTCKANGVPCIITTTNQKSDYIEYDYYMGNSTWDRHPRIEMDGAHPNGKGYRTIADDLLKIYANLL